MTTQFMDPLQQVLEGMMSMGHTISIAGMPGVLQPHDKGYLGLFAEEFLVALGATLDTPIELHVANSQADAHAEISLCPDHRQWGHAPAHAHGEGYVQDGRPLHSLEAWADRAERHSAIWGWRRLWAEPAGRHRQAAAADRER